MSQIIIPIGKASTKSFKNKAKRIGLRIQTCLTPSIASKELALDALYCMFSYKVYNKIINSSYILVIIIILVIIYNLKFGTYL